MIIDDTLREGLQTPGISFTIQEKLNIASLLKKAGIERALVSYPSAHKSEARVAKEIVQGRYFKETFALGRTIAKDIDSIYETGANIAMHLPFKVDNVKDIVDAVRYAASKDRIVEVAVVDIVQYSEEELLKMARMISDAGADIIQLPDTMGSASPSRMRRLVSNVKKNLEASIEVHCHDDLGASVANSLAGVEAGADLVDTAVYGMGERNGIADMATVSSLLEKEGYDTGIKVDSLREVYSYVSELILQKVGPSLFFDNYPVFGKNTAIHTAGTHAAFSDVFKGSNFSVNVYTGKKMVANILKTGGIELDNDGLRQLVDKIKDRAVDSGKAISSAEILEMAEVL